MLNLTHDNWLALDRLAHKRDNPKWIEQCLNAPSSRFIVMWRARFPMAHESVQLLTRTEVEALSDEPLNYYFLGQVVTSQQYLFAVELIKPNQTLENWQSMRHHDYNEPLTDILLYAQGLLNWHRVCLYCEKCGTPLNAAPGGNKRLCKNVSCLSEVFPRINPAIIVLLLNKERCLLAKSKQFTGEVPMFSCIAGFTETGETFSQTLRREVYEEVGLHIESDSYFGNQPWPFPASLMIGYHAYTTDTEVVFHDGEIEAAQWFSRDELRDACTANSIRLPSQKSISFSLIAHWYDKQSAIPLAEIIKM